MSRSRSCWKAAAAFGFVALVAGCAENKDVGVQLETHRQPAFDPRQLEVEAVVLGPQTGLHYKWFSVNGDFDPQDSYTPKAEFTFAPSSEHDRIWVEVWRDMDKVAETHLDVTVDTRTLASSWKEKAKGPAPELSITRIPRYQAEGGPDTRDTISGIVHGRTGGDYRILVYARADAWYIQPTPFSLQPIENDGTWQTWTHTGSNYAALVVQKEYKPMTRLDVLPQLDADVLARQIVEGRKQ
jgi:hypothetical protein